MTSDSLTNDKLTPDATAFLDDLLPGDESSSLTKPVALPIEMLVPDSATLYNNLLPEDKALPPEEPVAMSSGPGTSDPVDFLPLDKPLSPEEFVAPQNELPASDTSAFLADTQLIGMPSSLEEPAALPSELLAPDASAFLADTQPIDMSSPLKEPAALPSELLAPDASAFFVDTQPIGMSSPLKEPAALPSESLAPDASAFLAETQSIDMSSPLEEFAASPSEPFVPDASDFLGDILSMDKSSMPDGLLTPSEALSIARETGERNMLKSGKRADSITGQGVLVSNLQLFIRFDQASEVSEMTQIFRLPGTPKWVCGLVNLHGNLVPVLDIASFFNLPNDASEKSMLLVLGHEENALAVTVSGIPERLRFSEDDRIPAPLLGEYLQPYVPGAFTRGNDIWLELEHEKLLRTLAATLAS